MNRLSKNAVLLILLGIATGFAAAPSAAGTVSTPKQATQGSSVPLGMLPRAVVPTHYRLAFTIDPAKDRFSGHAEIEVQVAKPQAWFYLHGLDLHVTQAAARLASGKLVPARYAQVHDSGVAKLTLSGVLPKGSATLVFDYDAPFGQSLAGLYKVVDAGQSYAFTQFESIDARRAFPGFDEPGFKTPFDVTVTVPAADKVVANTPEASTTPAGDGMTKWVFEPTRPLPTYLIALAVGPLDIVDAGSVPPNQFRHYPLLLRGIAAKGMGSKLKYALSLTPGVVTALENYYGVGYPFQKLDTLAVPDFAAGAMENSGAITYREQLLLMDDNAPLEQRRSSLTVQAHEIAHQWFGDLVTPKWWDDIWLNESFATWMEYKIAQTVRPKEEYSRSTLNSSLDVMQLDELPAARQIHNPVNNPDDIDNAFDNITYSKGGAVLSMFESFVGPLQFEKGIHVYLQKFAYRNASAHDFISTIARVTNHPEIVQAFGEFIDQPHIPLLKMSVRCDTAGASAQLRQSMYKPLGITMPDRRWHVPACLTTDGGSRICKLVPPPSAQVELGKSCPDLVFPNASGAGYYRFALDEPHWRTLIQSDQTLSPADQLTLFHNVTAAMRGGYASAADFRAVIHALAPVAKWDAVSAIHDVLHEMRVTGIFGPAEIQETQAMLRGDFGPRMQQLGLGAKPNEDAASVLLRQYLAALLVEEGNDRGLIAELAKAGHIYLASGGKDNGGIPPELRREALRAAVVSDGPAFGDSLIEAVKATDDAYFVQTAIFALAGAQDEATLNKLLALALTPAIRTGNLRYVLQYYAAEPNARPVLWSWFKANFDALEKRVSKQGMGYSPDIQHYACDAETKADLDTFLGQKVSQLTGAPRVLKETDERIERCMAFRRAKGAELAAALASMK